MRVADIMKKPPITCHVNDTLEAATRAMWHYDLGAVIVLRDDGKATGIITDRDICLAAFREGRALADLLVHSAMSSHLFVARPHQSLDEIGSMMKAHQIHRMPVVDDDGHPLGMITLNDLAEASVHRSGLRPNTTTVARILASITTPRFPEESAA
jgi:CBS domain-containing protein